MNTASRKPDSVSSVNITPLAPTSLRTMCWTPTEIATWRVVEALVRAVRDRAVVVERGVDLVHRGEHGLARRARSGSSPAGRRTRRPAGPRQSPTSARRAPRRRCRGSRPRRALRARVPAGTASRGSSRGCAPRVGEARDVVDVETGEFRGDARRRARPARGNRGRPAPSSRSRRARARRPRRAARSSRRARRSCRRRTRCPSCGAVRRELCNRSRAILARSAPVTISRAATGDAGRDGQRMTRHEAATNRLLRVRPDRRHRRDDGTQPADAVRRHGIQAGHFAIHHHR